MYLPFQQKWTLQWVYFKEFNQNFQKIVFKKKTKKPRFIKPLFIKHLSTAVWKIIFNCCFQFIMKTYFNSLTLIMRLIPYGVWNWVPNSLTFNMELITILTLAIGLRQKQTDWFLYDYHTKHQKFLGCRLM